MNTMLDGYINTKDTAIYLDLHEMTVYRLFNKGKLPCIRVGGRWRTKKEWLDRHLLKDNKNGLA